MNSSICDTFCVHHDFLSTTNFCLSYRRAMLLHIGAFGLVDRASVPGGYQVAIKEAFESFTRWRKLHKIQSSQRRFHYKGIFNDVYGCYLNSKGFNARILCEWLLHEIIRVRSQPGLFLRDERLQSTENALRLDTMKITVCISSFWNDFQIYLTHQMMPSFANRGKAFADTLV